MEIPAGKFKAECLKLMDRVNTTHEEIVILKRGTPVARLVPVRAAPRAALFGFLSGCVSHENDIVSPSGGEWNASR